MRIAINIHDVDNLQQKVRLGYCFTPYQRLWLYNGAPLVAFYDTLGIRRTYSRLKPPASGRGHRGFKSRIRPPYPQRVLKGDYRGAVI